MLGPLHASISSRLDCVAEGEAIDEAEGEVLYEYGSVPVFTDSVLAGTSASCLAGTWRRVLGSCLAGYRLFSILTLYFPAPARSPTVSSQPLSRNHRRA